jgi:hypothetical protein
VFQFRIRLVTPVRKASVLRRLDRAYRPEHYLDETALRICAVRDGARLLELDRAHADAVAEAVRANSMSLIRAERSRFWIRCPFRLRRCKRGASGPPSNAVGRRSTRRTISA